jgi:prolyl-tRNA editing enzyme YbaK/EbsC (Cys-tRNA(Pro) deacylase)
VSALDRPAVQRVVLALAGAGIEGRVIELDGTARTAADAALACGVPVGAIVKSLVFLVGDRPVMALVAGDRRCRMAALAGAVDLEGEVRRADAERVRTLTGFAIGGVAPVGHPIPLPTVIDGSLDRFRRLFAAAGHPHCVFATDLAELARLTQGRLSDDVAEAAS